MNNETSCDDLNEPTESAAERASDFQLNYLREIARGGKPLDSQVVAGWLLDALCSELIERRARDQSTSKHMHCGSCDSVECAGMPAAVIPGSPSPQWLQKARAEGRAEALALLLGESAESFSDQYMGSHAIADTGDYGTHWKESELRDLLRVEEATYSYIDQICGTYWSQQAEIEDLKEEASTWGLITQADEAAAFHTWWERHRRESFQLAYGDDEPFEKHPDWGLGHLRYAREGWMARAKVRSAAPSSNALTSADRLERLADEFSTTVEVTVHHTPFKAGSNLGTVLRAMRKHSTLSAAASLHDVCPTTGRPHRMPEGQPCVYCSDRNRQ